MPTAKLRRSGGATIVSLPKALLEQIGLGPNASVDITLEGGRLIVVPAAKQSLAEWLDTLEPLGEADKFPDVDEGLLPLDEIDP
jgi:antitoxin component of MazEF toxin-antitoxin module